VVPGELVQEQDREALPGLLDVEPRSVAGADVRHSWPPVIALFAVPRFLARVDGKSLRCPTGQQGRRARGGGVGLTIGGDVTVVDGMGCAGEPGEVVAS
jgi:hypothetical protein